MDKYLEIQQTLTGEEEVAFLNRFLDLNPNWRGGTVSDVLFALEDSDCHINVTKPIYAELMYHTNVCELIVPCTHVLIYIKRKPPTSADVMDFITRVKLVREKVHYDRANTVAYVKGSLNQSPFSKEP